MNVHLNTRAKGNPVKSAREGSIILRFERPTSQQSAKSNRKTRCFQSSQSYDKQDWRSPVYSGRFEYICWNSLYSPHFCIHFLLSPTLGLPTRFIDALFGVHITGISGWNLWCVTHHITRIWFRSHHWLSFCSRVYRYLYGMRYLKSRSTWAQWKTSGYSLKWV